jgi:hypothetical protein
VNETGDLVEDVAKACGEQDDKIYPLKWQCLALDSVIKDSKAGEATKSHLRKRKHKEGKKRVSKGSLKKSKPASTRNVAGRKTGVDCTTAVNGDSAAKERETSTREQCLDSDTHMVNDDATNNWNGDAWDDDDYYWDEEYGF